MEIVQLFSRCVILMVLELLFRKKRSLFSSILFFSLLSFFLLSSLCKILFSFHLTKFISLLSSLLSSHPLSPEKALLWAKMATESGSLFGKGLKFYYRKDYLSALDILLPFAQQGVSIAERFFSFSFSSFLFFFSSHLSRTEILFLFFLSFFSPNFSLLFSLSLLCSNRCVGKCLETKNEFEKAGKYYLLSASKGNASGQNNLGCLYLFGKGFFLFTPFPLFSFFSLFSFLLYFLLFSLSRSYVTF